MKACGQGLVGLDVKPRRNTRVRKNHFRATHSPWLLPALIALVSLGVMIGLR